MHEDTALHEQRLLSTHLAILDRSLSKKPVDLLASLDNWRKFADAEVQSMLKELDLHIQFSSAVKNAEFLKKAAIKEQLKERSWSWGEIIALEHLLDHCAKEIIKIKDQLNTHDLHLETEQEKQNQLKELHFRITRTRVFNESLQRLPEDKQQRLSGSFSSDELSDIEDLDILEAEAGSLTRRASYVDDSDRLTPPEIKELQQRLKQYEAIQQELHHELTLKVMSVQIDPTIPSFTPSWELTHREQTQPPQKIEEAITSIQKQIEQLKIESKLAKKPEQHKFHDHALLTAHRRLARLLCIDASIKAHRTTSTYPDFSLVINEREKMVKAQQAILLKNEAALQKQNKPKTTFLRSLFTTQKLTPADELTKSLSHLINPVRLIKALQDIKRPQIEPDKFVHENELYKKRLMALFEALYEKNERSLQKMVEYYNQFQSETVLNLVSTLNYITKHPTHFDVDQYAAGESKLLITKAAETFYDFLIIKRAHSANQTEKRSFVINEIKFPTDFDSVTDAILPQTKKTLNALKEGSKETKELLSAEQEFERALTLDLFNWTNPARLIQTLQTLSKYTITENLSVRFQQELIYKTKLQEMFDILYFKSGNSLDQLIGYYLQFDSNSIKNLVAVLNDVIKNTTHFDIDPTAAKTIKALITTAADSLYEFIQKKTPDHQEELPAKLSFDHKFDLKQDQVSIRTKNVLNSLQQGSQNTKLIRSAEAEFERAMTTNSFNWINPERLVETLQHLNSAAGDEAKIWVEKQKHAQPEYDDRLHAARQAELYQTKLKSVFELLYSKEGKSLEAMKAYYQNLTSKTMRNLVNVLAYIERNPTAFNIDAVAAKETKELLTAVADTCHQFITGFRDIDQANEFSYVPLIDPQFNLQKSGIDLRTRMVLNSLPRAKDPAELLEVATASRQRHKM